MQCACPILSSVAWLTLQYFSTLPHKRHDFRKTKLFYIKCFDFVWNISHSKKNWARYDQKCTYIGLHVKYPLFFSDFNETWILMTDFIKKTLKYQISWKSDQWEPSCSMRTDRCDVMKLIVAFRNFANAPKNQLLYGVRCQNHKKHISHCVVIFIALCLLL